jgi:gluconolactonase
MPSMRPRGGVGFLLGSTLAGASVAAALDDAAPGRDTMTGSPPDAAETGSPVWTCPPGPFGGPLPAGGATPTRVAGLPPKGDINMQGNGFTNIEGPVWIGDTLYVSEFPGSPSPPPSRILFLTGAGTIGAIGASGTDGGVDTGSNGLAVDRAGNLYAGVHKDGSISRIDLATGARTPVATTYLGLRFNSPNDLAIRSDGTIYFSDPSYQAPNNSPVQAQTRVYRVAPGGAVSVVDATLTQPNGVTLSVDESTLYVSSNNGLYAYPVMADGSTGPRPATALSTMNLDGMAIDCAGNLYAALINSPNILVLGPTGSSLGTITVPTPTMGTLQSVTNAAFGGADHKTLYISAQGSSGGQGLFQVALNVPGMPY